MTQAERVLDYIKRFGSINTLEAFSDLAITRLSARIFELRKEGHKIISINETGKNRFGESVYYAKYYLESEEN